MSSSSASSYAQLYQSNQQLQLKIAQLESQQLSFTLFQRQIKQQLESLVSTRNQLQGRVELLVEQLEKQKLGYEEKMGAKQQENTRLRIQTGMMKQQRERDLQIITKMEAKFKSMQDALVRKTEIMNKYFKKKLEEESNS